MVVEQIIRSVTHIHIPGLLLLVLSFLYTQPALAQPAASISIKLETPELYEGDVLVLEIESIGLLEPLDIQPLTQQAEFLRETTGTRISVVKGKVVEIALRRMEFIVKQGKQVLGPLQAETIDGLVVSNAVSVNVQAALTQAWQPSDGDATITVSTSNANPWFGEQTLLSITLAHRYAIADEKITLPSLERFDVVPIHEERRTIDNNTGIRSISWRYLIHPRESGLLSLDGVDWRGTLIRSRTQRAEFAYASKPTTLAVQQAQVEKSDWWLPARSLNMRESWSHDMKQLSAGDEVLRTITLEANGILASQLPDVTPLQSRAIQSDLIKVEREHELIGEQTRATGIYTYRVTALSPIPVFLDTVRVPWWNVELNETAEAIIPARRINVGLPDRADMLAEIALQGSRTERWWYQLQSTTLWARLAIASVALASLAYLLKLALPQLNRFRVKQSTRAYRRQILRAWQTQRWPALYEALNASAAHELNADAKRVVSKKVEGMLFDNADKLRTNRQPTQHEIELMFQQANENPLDDALPSL